MLNDLFPHSETIALPGNAIVLHEKSWLSEAQCIAITKEIESQVELELAQIHIAGKLQNIPRLQAWMGDSDAVLEYSGMRFIPAPWTPEIKSLKTLLEASVREEWRSSMENSFVAGRQDEQYLRLGEFRFNSVLVNAYRNENDSVGWHADDERELGPNPIIASLSLGGQRRFCLKPKPKLKAQISPSEAKTRNLELNSGDLLLMYGCTQEHWLHSIPKENSARELRYNLTFRNMRFK